MLKNKNMKKWLSMLWMIAIMMTMIPSAAFAQSGQITVNVKIENTTFTEDMGNGAPSWSGTLIDTKVTIPEGSTMLDAVKAAAEAENKSIVENGYISEVEGLGESDAVAYSGWTATLNDWFTNVGIGDVTVEDGDEIALLYTVTWGDLGGVYGDNDKTVKSLEISGGELSPDFDKDTKEYTLSIDSGIEEVYIRPTASNKNFQVKMISNGQEYKMTEAIPVQDGTVIEVVCGDPSWPTMNDAADVPAETYTITVDKPETVDVTIRNQKAGTYLNGFSQTVTVAADLAESYGYSDSVTDGVSALDALVKAHEMIYGEEFTAQTKDDYLQMSGSTIRKIFSVPTYSTGFLVNEEYPVYPGTTTGSTVDTQEIFSGDVIDFFILTDESFLTDLYTWVDAPSYASSGQKIIVTVTQKMFLMMMPEYDYDKSPMEDSQLVWINAETGEETEIDGASTDENGQATFTIPDDMADGKYYIAASSSEWEYVIKNPAVIYINKDNISAEISLHDGMDKAALYTEDDTYKKNDLLENVQAQNGSYTFDIAPGRYILEAFTENSIAGLGTDTQTMTSLGTVEILIDEDNAALEVMAVNASCTNEGWTYGKDYTIENIKVRGDSASDGGYRSVQAGEAAGSGALTFILLKGDTYSFDVIPQGDKAEDYASMTVSGTVTSDEDGDITFTVSQKTAAPDIDAETIRKAYEETGAYLADIAAENGLTVASEGGDWIVLGLARAGYDVPDSVYQQYYDNVKEYVAANINENEQLHRSRSTENSRVILALTALGLDPSDVDGHNLLAGLSDMEYVSRQGINGIMYALIAFDSGNYDIPAVYEGGVQVTREGLIRAILDAQLDDGGWSLAGTTADIDMTAIAVQALAPYYDDNEQVKTAVDEALQLLSERQSDNGGYGSFESANIESCAQVLTALTAMGIDPLEDGRFIKDGNTVLDAILGYYVEGGGFEHVSGYGINQLATEQGYYALVSYYRMLDGQTALYDMTDIKDEPIFSQDESDTEQNGQEDNANTEGAAEGSETVKTGDQNDLAMLWVICGLGAAGTVFAAYSRKKEN